MASRHDKTKSQFNEVMKDLKHITDHQSDPSQIHIENFIGFTRVPVGLVGPLRVHESGAPGEGEGEGEGEDVYAPLATTEAALVASCSRGCKAFNQCGGIHFETLSDGMSRTPAFKFTSPASALAFARQVPSFQSELTKVAESSSRHLQLLSLTPTVIGSTTHVHFNYTSGDAAGQNMVSIATHRACHWLLSSDRSKPLNIQAFILEGSLSSDKKSSWTNTVNHPRGVEAMAWGSITNEVARATLGCSTEQLHQTFTGMVNGGIRAGIHGNGANAMNVVAAMFIATGQDVASVAEACWNQLTPEYDFETKVLTLSLYVPSLPVGTVGGGTHLDSQREGLEILKCNGRGKKRRLAGLVVAFALALDVSTIAAFTNDTFAQSHDRLRRKAGSAKI
ncbi:hmg-CoA reductase [Aspergillus heteromorphus CBS 117.55]|uniref:hydroxymethylglutaryl-CoA reductase (NADPH) n=1 Tax=Aspergillus heteromorphus CBS 117.55 TaxID=1448321 RepID=A0A317V1R2_9EURO|nr:hmg-CoA reductase [Aspergillus heteromorphus CBS 117.55]PWY66727.1 hmg-CoA reductase [Aspergillus heteromorphus CBS 117.55]